MNNIPYDKRILFRLHPNVATKPRRPDKISILKDSLIDIHILKKEENRSMLLTSIRMLLNITPPSMNTLYDVYRHIS